ncbi:scavenger receptor class B member 1-like isoform X1 [Leptonychotes weddellii]|uniref:Scavenger receptor class B member 1 n=2 Tax=Monachinae TaxID=3410119 RepID=A0A7F8RHZ6_LEPWE|nr:scavenger receptor class B member 1-like isoform X1 [Leptonychotes weddellii]
MMNTECTVSGDAWCLPRRAQSPWRGSPPCPPSGAGPGAPASPGPSLCFVPQVTGIPMNCSVKLQLSLYIKAIKGIGQTGKIQPVVLPLVWFEESGAMEGEPLQTFYTQLVLMPSVLHYAQYVLLALGCVLLLIPIIHQIRSQEKCYLFWSSSKKGSKDKEAIQAYSESLMTSAPKGTVLQEARL